MTRPDPAREARLAAALRDNLRRRKAQSREAPRALPGDSPSGPDQKNDDAQAASE